MKNYKTFFSQSSEKNINLFEAENVGAEHCTADHLYDPPGNTFITPTANINDQSSSVLINNMNLKNRN